MSDVVVAGGGLAGLVAARRLAESGRDVTLFERRDEVGGRVRSRRVDGFTLDRGFQVLFTACPAVRRELDLDALDLRPFAAGATIARPGHRSTLADPLRHPLSALPSLLNTDISVADKLRVIRLRRELGTAAPAACFEGADESVRAYLDRAGFSERFVENVAAPFYGGVTLDRSLSTSAAVFWYTFAMLAGGRAAVPAGGAGAIPAQLVARAREAGATVETGTAVRGIDADGDGATVETSAETRSADAAVVATGPKAAAELTGVDAVPTSGRGCVTQYFATGRRRRLDTGRKLILNAAGDRPNHVAPLSAVAPEYAPDGRELISATTLGTPDAGDADLAADVRDALAAWYPEHRFDDLDLLATDRIEFAQFDQPPGFYDRLPDVDAPEGPVYLAGDYTRWSSIQGAMESGRVAADAVADEI